MAKRKELNAVAKQIQRLIDGDYGVVDGKGLSTEMYNLLCKARSMAEQFNRSYDEANAQKQLAVAGLAHDFKTPLAVIMGAVECIQAGMTDKDYLSVIYEQASHLGDLAVQMADSARQEMRAVPERKQTTFAPDYFPEQVGKCTAMANGAGVKLRCGRVPRVEVVIDRIKVSRALQNVIYNAIRFTPVGGTVRVRFDYRDGRLAVKVIDHGVGMSKEVVKHVFDKFYTQDASRQSGTGLGLYVAKDIVEEMGGSIKAHSREGHGSTFVISLPTLPLVKRSLTQSFDQRSMPVKVAVTFLAGWLFSWFYRLLNFLHTRSIVALAGFCVTLVLFPFAWMFDMASLAVYGRYKFMVE